jgi:hypothetical protein
MQDGRVVSIPLEKEEAACAAASAWRRLFLCHAASVEGSVRSTRGAFAAAGVSC